MVGNENTLGIITSDLDGTLVSGRIPVPSPLVDSLEWLLAHLHEKERLTGRSHGSEAVKAVITRMAQKRRIAVADRLALHELHAHAMQHKRALALLSGRQSYLEKETERFLDSLQIRQYFEAIYLNLQDLSSLEHKTTVTGVLAGYFEYLIHVEDDVRVALALCEIFPQLTCYLVRGALNDTMLRLKTRAQPENLQPVQSFAEASHLIQHSANVLTRSFVLQPVR